MGLVVDLLLSKNPALRTDSAAVPCLYVLSTHAHNDQPLRRVHSGPSPLRRPRPEV
jgi:hypothetical protein